VVLVFACEKGCFGGEGFLVPEGRGCSLAVVVCGDMVCLFVVLVPTVPAHLKSFILQSMCELDYSWVDTYPASG
jgi:hypothetical protein